MMVLTMPLSIFDKKSAGYPIGGSMAFAKRIEQSYLKLGGTMHYNTPVIKVITEEGVAKGLLVRNKISHYSDLTISAADWKFTVFDALDGKFVNQKGIDLKSHGVENILFSDAVFVWHC
ncbi:MAG: hypothetical protein IPJ06_02685 [Saprospiraceae bacterium]|nr:hypothetical protein [Saprospiraceae bacterium]